MADSVDEIIKTNKTIKMMVWKDEKTIILIDFLFANNRGCDLIKQKDGNHKTRR